jgi:DNA-directed RNA polymerase sigma subunit (sigma70/sigma32)
MSKELRLEMRLKNNRLITAREELGYESVAAFCRASGMHQSLVGRYENLKESPLTKNKDGWKPSAKQLAAFFGLSCEYLWPESLEKVVQTSVVKKMDVDSFQNLLNAQCTPEELLGDKEELERVQRSMKGLPPMQNFILKRHFGLDGEPEETLEEIGDKFCLSRERIRSIEAQGLGHIRRDVF